MLVWCVCCGKHLMREFPDYFFGLCLFSVRKNLNWTWQMDSQYVLQSICGFSHWIVFFFFLFSPKPPPSWFLVFTKKGKLEAGRNGSMTHVTAGRRDQMPSEPRQGSKVGLVLMITWWSVLPLSVCVVMVTDQQRGCFLLLFFFTFLCPHCWFSVETTIVTYFLYRFLRSDKIKSRIFNHTAFTPTFFMYFNWNIKTK